MFIPPHAIGLLFVFLCQLLCAGVKLHRAQGRPHINLLLRTQTQHRGYIHFGQIAFITPLMSGWCVSARYMCVYTLIVKQQIVHVLTWPITSDESLGQPMWSCRTYNREPIGVIVGLSFSLLSVWLACLSATIISSPGTMLTRWHSSMWILWFTAPPVFFPTKTVSHPALSPSLSLSLSLWYGSLLGTDQVYDPVSLNQNKAAREEQETERQSVLLSRLAVLFTITTNVSIFRFIVLVENVWFRVLIICCLTLTVVGFSHAKVQANELK